MIFRFSLLNTSQYNGRRLYLKFWFRYYFVAKRRTFRFLKVLYKKSQWLQRQRVCLEESCEESIVPMLRVVMEVTTVLSSLLWGVLFASVIVVAVAVLLLLIHLLVATRE